MVERGVCIRRGRFFTVSERTPSLKRKTILGVQVTKALPGTLVILCEGRNREGFYICRSCGAHMTGPKGEHKIALGFRMQGQLWSGSRLVTNWSRMWYVCSFQDCAAEWDAYSVAHAVLLGAAETLDVPDTDLNVTITGGDNPGESAIVLYDNVPGGAGLVAQLEWESVFDEVLHNARERVRGNCGCDSSCYGCLRSYRNQFAHSHLEPKAGAGNPDPGERGQVLNLRRRSHNLSQDLANPVCDTVDRGFQAIVGEMRVAGRRVQMVVAHELSDLIPVRVPGRRQVPIQWSASQGVKLSASFGQASRRSAFSMRPSPVVSVIGFSLPFGFLSNA